MKTPYFLVDEQLIEKNLKILAKVKKETDCKILLAQKAFSSYDFYPLISKYLDGTTTSGLFEARLGQEKFGKETHVFAPAFTDGDMHEITKICDHIVFNSKAQLLKHYDACKKANMQIGVRVNPEHRTQDHDIYDPCAPFSRFGIRAVDLDDEILSRVDGLHFHTLCEQDFEPLKQTLAVFEKKFAKALSQIGSKGRSWWVNFGGGHHITRDDYNVDGLIKLINDFKKKYNAQVYLEPGEAVVLNSGFAYVTVMDIVHNEKEIAIVDFSPACHAPDILIGHYRPIITGATLENEASFKQITNGYKYRLASTACLAGDIIGDYIFDKPLEVDDIIEFCDMAIYTITYTSMFNGINTPSIYKRDLNGRTELLREFGFADYMSRLGR